MGTATTIVTAARRRIGIQAEEEALSSAEGANGLALLQAMLGSWVEESSIKAYSADGLAESVTVTIYGDTVLSNTDFAITANLAVRMAGSYHIPLPPDVVVDADNGKDAIVRKQVVATQNGQTYAYDKGMVYMPSWTLQTVISDE